MSGIYDSLNNVEKEKLKRGEFIEKSNTGDDIKKSLVEIKGSNRKKINLIPIMIFSLLFVILIIVNIIFYNQQKQNDSNINQAFLKFQEIENSINETNQQVSIISNNFSNIESNLESVKTNLDNVGRIVDVSRLTLVKFDSRMSYLERDNANRKIAIDDITKRGDQLLKKYSELRVNLEKFKYLLRKSEEVTLEPIIVTGEMKVN
ncbi:MAG: hypothetical protein KAJ79_01100 [Candidatus Omnitrophica bacterium]|nr:hypothetical protein [Candidatus Omnitrophota bacterium]MCK5287632.1 hypothetical protein [Candidatus Omnitrophota bacterium]